MSLSVTVLTGGSTPERDVALAGAGQVVAVLRERGHAVTVVDTTHGTLSDAEEQERLYRPVDHAPPSTTELEALATRELGPALLELPAVRNADLVFLVLHGKQGEGGFIQALLDQADIPFTGSGPLASAVAMDKDIAKRLFRDAGIPTPAWATWPADDNTVRRLGLPLVVKPSKVGSTVGLSVIRHLSDLPAAVAEAARYDDEVILEEFVDGAELTVGVLGSDPLAVGEIRPSHEIFDYECKYTPGMSEEIFPAPLPDQVAQNVRELARRAHLALKLRDFSRIDFRQGPDGQVYCLEANTLPGLTVTSLLPQSAAAAGIPFGALCERICGMVLKRHAARNITAS